jgi:hypothetical protein
MNLRTNLPLDFCDGCRTVLIGQIKLAAIGFTLSTEASAAP